ncbi:MAG: 4Fe-4S dicluster domain-containing protein [Alistipes sp.]
MNNFKRYICDFFTAVATLLIGLKTTLREFFTRKTTECYPENRAVLKLSPRFRGTLTLLHDDQNRHQCVACGLCQAACPNGTIRIVSRQETTDEGKSVRVLDTYEYDLGSCIFCQLCVNACPHQAIAFDQEFEHAVFDRSKLVMKLNKEGSTLKK